MNCQEFEQRVWAEPHCREAAFSEHHEACADCARLAAEVLAFEAQLDGELAVEVPRGLQRRIRQRRRAQFADESPGFFGRLFGGSSSWVNAYAVAATVVLAIGVLNLLPEQGESLQPLDRLVAEHYAEERFALRVGMQVTPGQLETMFAGFGARLVEELPGVAFANGCVMENGIKGAHLVVNTPTGKVTVLVIPHRGIDAPRSFQVEGLQARLTPYNAGTLAVVGPDSDSLDIIEKRMRNSVRWL